MKKPAPKHKGGGSKKQAPKGAPMPPGPGMDTAGGPPPGLLAALGAGGPAGDVGPAGPVGGGIPAGPGASMPPPMPPKRRKGAP